jgi:hypothetical protein
LVRISRFVKLKTLAEMLVGVILPLEPVLWISFQKGPLVMTIMPVL